MAHQRTVKVPCPACGEQVTVKPYVTGVYLEAGRLHTTMDVPSVTHPCQITPRPTVGFAAASDRRRSQ